jgi:hypothetical protein
MRQGFDKERTIKGGKKRPAHNLLTGIPYPGYEVRVDSAGFLALYSQSWKTAPIGQRYNSEKPIFRVPQGEG